jgi:hypothetical protein
MGARVRAYAVLIEVRADSRFDDSAFVLLGVYEAKAARGARRSARAEHDLSALQELVTVPTRYWRAET